MPRPPRLCSCGKIVPHGQPCACQLKATRERKARHDARRPSARQRGYTAEWDRARALWLSCNPSCARCEAPATTVDHITPHRGDPRLFWSTGNWQSLCTPCHVRHKQRLEREGGRP